jgi:hypothetical protein
MGRPKIALPITTIEPRNAEALVSAFFVGADDRNQV